MAKHALVLTNQFRGCNSSSTLDMGLMLLHNIQLAQQARLKTGLLLFDIQGFFDNINHNRLTHDMACTILCVSTESCDLRGPRSRVG